MSTDADYTTYFLPKSAGGEPGAESLRAFHVKGVNADSRRITAVASREMIDRDGDIVSIAALKAAIKGYMENPVILSGHSHRLGDGRSPVVGKVVDYYFERKDLIITVEFATTALAEEFWILYRDKFQRAFSIGFRGLEAKDEYIDGKRVRVFTKIELYEISVVSIPSNPAALSKNFVQQKRFSREKQRILDDPDSLIELLDRFENACFDTYPVKGCVDVPDDSPVWGKFSAAERAVLVEINKDAAGWGFDIDDAGFDLSVFGEDLADDTEKSFSGVLSDSGDEDYAKYF